MALEQATTPVTTVQIANNTVALWLDRFVRLAVRAPKVGLSIIWQDTQGRGKNSYVKAINERSRLTGVAVVVQNDAAPEARATLTQSTITGDRRGLRTFILDQADLVSQENEFMVNAGQLVEAHDAYWHTQILALFTSITATSGNNAVDHTLQNWDTVTALFRNDNHHPGKLWSVMHSDAIRDLRSDLRTNAAALFGTSFGEAEARAVLNTDSGLGVMFDGYKIYESEEVPVGDTTGWTNALGITNGPLTWAEIDSYQAANIKFQRDESRYGGWTVIGSIAGVGIGNQNSCRRFITRT